MSLTTPTNTISFRFFHIRAIFLLFVAIAISYSNSLNASWHLDDFPNILYNKSIQIDNLSIESLLSSFSGPATDSQLPLRYLSYLSFALNWLIGEDLVVGYHLFNIASHILTTFLLYATIQIFFKIEIIGRNFSKRQTDFIAISGALFWGLHPINTQAVTYLVQRMTSLAGMFYLASFLLYLIARLSNQSKQRFTWGAFSLLFFILALFSKENSVLIIPSILLSEIILFRTSIRQIAQNNRLAITLIVSIVTVFFFITYIHFLPKFINYLVTNYSDRPFTLEDRLLTQSRVILFYISLIFYPISSRFSIEHDIIVSTSLFTPVSTTLSIIIILSILLSAFISRKKYPLFSFAVFFFFVNHSIESTIIPLEMIFEHRNYVPSFFLLAGVISLFVSVFSNNRLKSSIKFITYIFFISATLILSISTYTRNFTYSTHLSLLEDTVSKAPNSGRALYNYTLHLYQTNKATPDEISSNARLAESLYSARINYIPIICNDLLYKMYTEKEEYALANAAAEKLFSLKPFSFEYIKRYATTLALSKTPNESYSFLTQILNLSNTQAIINLSQSLAHDQNLQAIINLLNTFSMQNGDYEKHFNLLLRSFKANPLNPGTANLLAKYYLYKNNVSRAESLLKWSLSIDATYIGTHLLMIELYSLKKDDNNVNSQVDDLLEKHTMNSILTLFSNRNFKLLSPPYAIDTFNHFLNMRLKSASQKLSKTSVIPQKKGSVLK